MSGLFVVSQGLQLDNPILNYRNLNGLRWSVWRLLLPVLTMNLIIIFFTSGLWQVTLILAFSSHIKSDNGNLTEPWAAADTNK